MTKSIDASHLLALSCWPGLIEMKCSCFLKVLHDHKQMAPWNFTHQYFCWNMDWKWHQLSSIHWNINVCESRRMLKIAHEVSTRLEAPQWAINTWENFFVNNKKCLYKFIIIWPLYRGATLSLCGQNAWKVFSMTSRKSIL